MNKTRNLQVGNIYINKSPISDSDDLLQVVMPEGVKTIAFRDSSTPEWDYDKTYSPRGISLVSLIEELDNKKYAESSIYIEDTKSVLGVFTGTIINGSYLEILTQGNIYLEINKDKSNPWPRILGLNDLVKDLGDDYSSILGTRIYWDILKTSRTANGDLINLTINTPSKDFTFTNLPLVGIILGTKKDDNKKISHLIINVNIDLDDYFNEITFTKKLNLDTSSNPIKLTYLKSFDDIPLATDTSNINTISIENLIIPLPSINIDDNIKPKLDLDIYLTLQDIVDNKLIEYDLTLYSKIDREDNLIKYSATFNIPKGFKLSSNTIILNGKYKLL